MSRGAKEMMRKTLRGALRIGKATSLALGVAVMLALTMGLASSALAGTGVNGVFNLGKTNTVNAITKLVGSVAGPSLQIDNNSTGASARALDLQVEPGNPPMTVNSGTKVANLNSDKLDGKDSSAFVKSVDVTPQPLTLINGWTKADFDPNTPAFYKDAEGLVHLGGAIGHPDGAANFDPFVILPAGSRPNHELFSPIYAIFGNSGTLEISPNGEMFVSDAGSNDDVSGYASLEGVTFRAVQ